MAMGEMVNENSVAGTTEVPKYKKILDELRTGIMAGAYRVGERLPSETDMGSRFSVSRLTVQRALKELQIEGLVDRRAGSGTYVSPRKQSTGHLFGLLIPRLGETEIFEPICKGMARAGSEGGHALLWGDTTHGDEGGADLARQLCSDYIERGVSGVFFAPVEGVENKDPVNIGISETLAAAGIPLVLLDRCVRPYPDRSRFDMVGIDNRRAGYRMTRHLIERGSRRPVFIGKAHMAPTVDARYAGFREAVEAHGCPGNMVLRCNPLDADIIADAMKRLDPDGFVCANDRTAVELMQVLDLLGVDVPGRVRVVGIDDVRYASHLRIPLTTLRQPCMALGKVAIQTMLSRIADPGLPARDIYLECELVERDSCGV